VDDEGAAYAQIQLDTTEPVGEDFRVSQCRPDLGGRPLDAAVECHDEAAVCGFAH